jgi:hypothetical protein
VEETLKEFCSKFSTPVKTQNRTFSVEFKSSPKNLKNKNSFTGIGEGTRKRGGGRRRRKGEGMRLSYQSVAFGPAKKE